MDQHTPNTTSNWIACQRGQARGLDLPRHIQFHLRDLLGGFVPTTVLSPVPSRLGVHGILGGVALLGAVAFAVLVRMAPSLFAASALVGLGTLAVVLLGSAGLLGVRRLRVRLPDGIAILGTRWIQVIDGEVRWGEVRSQDESRPAPDTYARAPKVDRVLDWMWKSGIEVSSATLAPSWLPADLGLEPAQVDPLRRRARRQVIRDALGAPLAVALAGVLAWSLGPVLEDRARWDIATTIEPSACEEFLNPEPQLLSGYQRRVRAGGSVGCSYEAVFQYVRTTEHPEFRKKGLRWLAASRKELETRALAPERIGLPLRAFCKRVLSRTPPEEPVRVGVRLAVDWTVLRADEQRYFQAESLVDWTELQGGAFGERWRGMAEEFVEAYFGMLFDGVPVQVVRAQANPDVNLELSPHLDGTAFGEADTFFAELGLDPLSVPVVVPQTEGSLLGDDGRSILVYSKVMTTIGKPVAWDGSDHALRLRLRLLEKEGAMGLVDDPESGRRRQRWLWNQMFQDVLAATMGAATGEFLGGMLQGSKGGI